MAQESWKETKQTECQTPEGIILCANNCGFFGSAMTNNLCSKCYKDHILKQQIMASSVNPEVEKASSAACSLVLIIPESEELNKLDDAHTGNIATKQPVKVSEKRLPNRCVKCQKKVGLTGFKCRCGHTFCSSHRYSESHECSFDYKTAGREAIAKENPVIMAEKIEKI